MAIPDLVGGLLPPSPDGEPYSAYPAEVEERFGFTPQRAQAWKGFEALRDLVDWLIRDDDNVPGSTWWLLDRFTTSADDVDEVTAVLLVPADIRSLSDARRSLLFTLLVRGNAGREHLKTSIRPVVLGGSNNDALLQLERGRCARNRLFDGAELIDSGWIEVL